MILQPLWVLRGTPSFSNQPINVRAKNCASVIHRKEWIELDLLQFALSRDASALAFKSDVLGPRKVCGNKSGIHLMLIGFDHNFR